MATQIEVLHKQKHPSYFSRFFTHKPQPTLAQHLLHSGAMEVWYQPIMDSQTSQIVGVEALARLRDEDGTLLAPAKFLPQLNDPDLLDLSQLVLNQALVDLPILDAEGCRLWVSVNVDPVSISESCIRFLESKIDEGVIDPSRITLEILEGSRFMEQESALHHLLAMKDLGVHLALDDVGSAYSSFLRVKDLPIDEIKLDQGFVRNLEYSPRDLHFVSSLQDLSAGLNIHLVVEGVETPDILDAITVMGAPLLQGYAIAKPMPLSELRHFLTLPRSIQNHPQSLLGLYARQLVHHNALKRILSQDPRLLDQATLLNPNVCPICLDVQHLGPEARPLYPYLKAYHQAIANAIATPSLVSAHDWSIIDKACEDFEEAIITRYHQRLSPPQQD